MPHSIRSFDVLVPCAVPPTMVNAWGSLCVCYTCLWFRDTLSPLLKLGHFLYNGSTISGLKGLHSTCKTFWRHKSEHKGRKYGAIASGISKTLRLTFKQAVPRAGFSLQLWACFSPLCKEKELLLFQNFRQCHIFTFDIRSTTVLPLFQLSIFLHSLKRTYSRLLKLGQKPLKSRKWVTSHSLNVSQLSELKLNHLDFSSAEFLQRDQYGVFLKAIRTGSVSLSPAEAIAA